MYWSRELDVFGLLRVGESCRRFHFITAAHFVGVTIAFGSTEPIIVYFYEGRGVIPGGVSLLTIC